jgi:hypothetical protein
VVPTESRRYRAGRDHAISRATAFRAHIDVNSGENAAAIEVLLGAARSAVPELILAAIADVTV